LSFLLKKWEGSVLHKALGHSPARMRVRLGIRSWFPEPCTDPTLLSFSISEYQMFFTQCKKPFPYLEKLHKKTIIMYYH
jgi:hypothetical protein